MKNIMQIIKLIIFTWIAFGSIPSQAQEKHFIYIQNENKQPFYVLLNKEVYSSTPGGYLIIPQLVAGKYDLATGFAKNQYPEQNFLVDLNKDEGFSLKQYGDKGWGLFDLQSFNTTMAYIKDSASKNANVQSVEGNTATIKVVNNETSKNDPLQAHDSAHSVTEVKAGVVEQSSSTKIKNEEASSANSEKGNSINETKKDPSTAVNSEKVTPKSETTQDSSTAAVTQKETSVNDIKKDPVTTSKSQKETSISETKQDPSTVVKTQKEISTIPGEVKSAPGKTRRSSPSSIVKTFAKSGYRGFDMIYIDKSGFKRDTIALLIPRAEKIAKATPTTVNTQELNVILKNNKSASCVQATDEDFYKTRLHIAAATTENSMMLVAKTAFKNNCFSTKQVKYLDVLFLSEESRLHFLELAKPYVYDAGNFSSLQSQFTEPAMIQQFRALLKKK